MTLNVTVGQQTPLTVTMGSIAAPSAIRPAPGEATVADFFYNTFSQNLRTLLGVSATPRRIEVRGTTGSPVFIAIGGRWGVVTTTVFVDNVVAGTRYVFADLSANDGAFTLAVAGSPVPAAWQVLICVVLDNGVALIWLDKGLLGLAAANGLLSLSGGSPGIFLADATTNAGVFLEPSGDALLVVDSTSQPVFTAQVNEFLMRGLLHANGASAGLRADDRVNARFATLYRTGDHVKLDDSVNGTIVDLSNTGKLLLTPVAGAVGLGVQGPTVPTTNLAEFDASAATNAQKVVVDKNGHLAVSQAAVPTGVLGTGAGNGAGTAPVLTVTGTDQAGTIQIVTGTQVPLAGAAVVTMSFKTAMASAPNAVIVTPSNGTAQGMTRAQDPVAVSRSTTGWVWFAGGSALPASSTLVWQYIVL